MLSMPSPTLRAALNETRAVLRKADAAWSKHACPSTAECCQLKTTGRPPWLWPSEWALLLERVRNVLPPARADGGCPFLDAGGTRCTVYEDRPFGCRTFFCHRVRGPPAVPSEATAGLLERLRALNLALDDEAKVQSLPEWHAAARLLKVKQGSWGPRLLEQRRLLPNRVVRCCAGSRGGGDGR